MGPYGVSTKQVMIAVSIERMNYFETLHIYQYNERGILHNDNVL